uniref:Helitron_like_N domain-containing protein n=1 Tax=Caenorhabditis tropicalis TaxID=1561998 RepID=A0A1I7UPX3_9PELO
MENSEFFAKRQFGVNSTRTREQQLSLVSQWIELKFSKESRSTAVPTSFKCVKEEDHTEETVVPQRKEKKPSNMTEEDVIEKKPDINELKGLESKPIIDSDNIKQEIDEDMSQEEVKQENLVSSQCDIKPELSNDETRKSASNELTPSMENDQMYHSDPGTSSPQLPYANLDEPRYDEDGHFIPNNQEYTRKMRKDYRRSGTLLTFKDVPGLVKYPCIVCNQRAESTTLRSVNNTDAYLMLYVCVKNNYYTLEKAKELARMVKFKCCVHHLTDMHDNALHWFGIVDPHIDIHTDNEKIVHAYQVVKEIKDSRFVQHLVFEGSRKHIIPFCTSLKKFFSKYGRQNYIAVKKPTAVTPMEDNGEEDPLVDKELMKKIRSQ